jgi:hypothetical protein
MSPADWCLAISFGAMFLLWGVVLPIAFCRANPAPKEK